jgi:rfaE bifunctional protein kinase chain/domain
MISSQELKKLFAKFNKLKVFVVGDAMIDRYWLGDIDRISPEAPVPIVNIHAKESRLGGAANVALNCIELGASVHLLTVLGNDTNAKDLLNLLKEKGIDTNCCLQSKTRKTTAKTRVISKHQQVIRIDEEITRALSIQDEHRFIDTCLRAIQIEKPDVLIFEDYNKGVLKENVIEKIIVHCKHVGVCTAVDPKKENFLNYIGVDIFKPNLKEIKEAMHMTFNKIDLPSLKKAHQALQQKLNHRVTLLTLSEHGIFTQDEKNAFLNQAHIRNIADVSGAGDTVIAVASMIYTITGNIQLMSTIANLAGGLVCEEVGVVPIDKKKLLAEAISVLTE